MKSLSKKLCLVCFAALAAVCLLTGTLFAGGKTASAASKVLKNAEYFEVTADGTFNGLTAAGITAAGNDLFTIEFPSGLNVTRIGVGAMIGNTRLEGITIPEGVTGVGTSAFSGCTSLKEISVPDSVSAIDARAFEGCASLSYVKLPENNAEFTDILRSTFSGCSSLLSITIPSSVSYIADNAFGGCNRLVEVCNKSELDVSGGLGGLNPLNVYTPSEGSSKILPADANGFVFYAGGTAGGNYLLSYCGGEAEITLPADYDGGNYGVYSEVFKDDASLKSVTVPENAKITSLGSGAFMGCTSLESVNLNDINISEIESNLFYGCTSLKSINIPASVRRIGVSAFKNCSLLSEVKFNKRVSMSEEKYYLETIYSSAFENCSSLEVISLPESVTNVQQNAFAGCVKLATVYLPDSATFGSGAFDSFNCPVLIAKDSVKYNAYLSGALSDYHANLAYVVELSLVYGGETHGDERLNIGYTYVRDGDSKIWKEGGKMPVQEGYKTSVWFKESAYKNEVDDITLNGLLVSGGNVTLYARTYTHEELSGELTVSKSLVYDGNEIGVNDAIGWTNALDGIYDISIADYSPFSGTASLPDKILNAGTYTVKAELKKEYGEWETPLFVPVTVQRAVKDLAKDFHWVSESGMTALDPSENPKTLYIYTNDRGEKIPYSEQYENRKPDASVPVITSYLTYSGEEYKLVLQEDKDYGGSFNVTYSGDFSASEAGVYKVSATIAADPNYIYKFTDGAEAIYRGLEVENLDGSDTRIISKTWYIVAARTNALSTEGGNEYKISSVWTYGDGAPSVPITAIGHGNEESLISFDLIRSPLNANEYSVVCEGMNYGRFADVINSSMPVGDYELTVTVGDYAERGTVYKGDTFIYKFSIENKPYSKFGEISFAVNERGVGEVKNSTTVHFAEISGWDKLDKAETLHALPSGNNFWAGYPEFYGGFEIYYSVVSETGSSGGYFTLDDYEGKTDNKPRVIPSTVGVYTVNYLVTAPGYNSLSGNYVLIVYEELSLESVRQSIASMHIVYNGEARTPNIDTDVYRAVYINNELDAEVVNAKNALGIESYYNYVNADDYPVALVIRSTHYVPGAGCYLYRWEGWQNVSVSTRQYARVTLTIGKAENKTRAPLTVTEWKYGEYSPEKNVIFWSTDWVTDVKAFDFELVPIGGGKSHLFSYRNGVNEFGNADHGVYKLIATCPAGNNYDIGKDEIGVVIGAAEISWKSAPYIESWKYGDFKKMFTVPEPVLNANVSELSKEILNGAYYTSVDDYNANNAGGRYSTIEEMIAASGDESGELPAGKYYLVYSYRAQGNYANFTELVSFQVLKADNYWDVPPVVNGWAYGDKSVDYLTYKPEFTPHYGDAKKVVIQYMALDANDGQLTGWEYSLADLGLDDYGKLNVGDYLIKATMSGSENYEEMAEFIMRFKVTRAANSWDDVPNVVSWNAGKINSVEDFLTVKPANGSVLISISDFNGKVIIEDELPQDINVNKLKSLGAGSYVLKAYVAGSDRYDELVAYVDFAIFEDSVSQTALIALTIVFAVIAIVLAVVGVVLLIRRDKKIEEEFRKMIKSELNRR